MASVELSPLQRPLFAFVIRAAGSSRSEAGERGMTRKIHFDRMALISSWESFDHQPSEKLL